MINNSLRLLTIASLVTTKKVFDVGCDHGYLSIYLAKDHNVVASDISEKSLKKTLTNMENSNVSFKCIQTDGLNGLKIKKNDTIIVSGMGTKTILEILNNKLSDNLIIQSNNSLYDLRYNIVKKGYYIDNEKVVYENNKYYVIIKFKKGTKKYSYLDLLLGVYTKENANYFKHLDKVYTKLYNDIPYRNIIKKLKTKYILNNIKKISKQN